MPIDRQEVGAHVAGSTVRLGLYLPGVRDTDGFDVRVRVIHSADQFVPEIPAVEKPLTFDSLQRRHLSRPRELGRGSGDEAVP